MRYCYLPALLLLLSCDPKPYVESVDIAFQVPLTVTPLRDTLRVGDTLWLTASFPDSIFERNTNRRYRVRPRDFDFKTRFGLYKFVDPTVYSAAQPGFTAGFAVVNREGQAEVQSQTFGALRFAYTGGRYQARIGFVARKPGVACLSIQDGANPLGVYDPKPDMSFLKVPLGPDGQPRRPQYASTVYILNDGRTNFHLLQQHAKPVSFTTPSEGNILAEQKGCYTFIVK